MICVLAWLAFSRTTYLGLLTGMLLTTVAYSFIFAAFQGLTALIGQEALMTGRLSALSNIFLFLPVGAAYFASGFMSEHLAPRQIFFMVLVLTTTLSVFGFWKPRSVFSHAYDNPHAQGSNFFGDVRRLLKHRAIYPVVLINLLLCTKFPRRKLLLWSVIIGVPQFIPMAFIHSGQQALAAVLIRLIGGLANAACIDITIRACPPGLQRTLMMIIAATFALSMRAGDLLGSWIYGLSPKYGFQYCVIAITVSYALILPVIPFIPKQITATADGEANPDEEALVLAEIGDASYGLPRRLSPRYDASWRALPARAKRARAADYPPPARLPDRR